MLYVLVKVLTVYFSYASSRIQTEIVSSEYSWGGLKGMGNTWLISVRTLSEWE